MHIKNEPGQGGWSGPFADLLRVQSEFQAKLNDETIRYLRRLQGALGPGSPGTVLLGDHLIELRAEGEPGGRAELQLELENLQRVHCVVTPQITPFVSQRGTTWFPSSDAAGGFRILPPGETGTVVLNLDIPKELPPDTYHGALVLLGFREGAVPVTVQVSDAGTEASPPGPASKRQAAKRSGRKKS